MSIYDAGLESKLSSATISNFVDANLPLIKLANAIDSTLAI